MWGFGKMQLQIQTEGYLIIPEVRSHEFLDEFYRGYENAVIDDLRLETVVPTLEDAFDHMGDFFYEIVSFWEFNGDSVAYHYLSTDIEKEGFYENALEEYYWQFEEDMKILAKRNHICVCMSDDIYINMPVKEVW
jgi:hypothetical protein